MSAACLAASIACAPIAGTVTEGESPASPIEADAPIAQARAFLTPECRSLGPNAYGVGDKCTRGGGECNGFAADLCSLDYGDTPYGACSMPCDANTDCGANADCSPDPLNPNQHGKIWFCMLNACTDPIPAARKPPPLKSCLPPTGPTPVIGTLCTAGSNACAGAPRLTCTSDVVNNPLLPICTTFCKGDAECGETARCLPAPGFPTFQLCIPTACLP